MLNATKVPTLCKYLVLSIIGVLLAAFSSGLASAAPAASEEAGIAAAVQAVVQAAKQYQAKTGAEATSVEQLVEAGLLKKRHDKAAIVTNDIWQVWGDGTGAYVLWDRDVSPEVCKKLNPGGTLPTNAPDRPDPRKGFQCVMDDGGKFHILEPLYIHEKK